MIEVLRIGQRVVRDDRVTTHVALVARAFGAERIFMEEVNPRIKGTISGINERWGGEFEVEIIRDWKEVVRRKKGHSKIIHLTMYGEEVDRAVRRMGSEDALIIVGAEKVPREIYEMADYNVSVGSQPHSEISALAVLLDRMQDGRQFSKTYGGAGRRIVPSSNGKKVVVEK